MKKLLLITLCALVNSTAIAAQYKEGWDAQNFYAEVLDCKKAAVEKTASGYVERGREKKQDEKILEDEVISMVPNFDVLAGSVCFCALNNIAKEKSYLDFRAAANVEPYMKAHVCRESMATSLQAVKANPGLRKLK